MEFSEKFKTKKNYYKTLLILNILLLIASGCGQSHTDKEKDTPTDLVKNNFLGVWKSIERTYPYSATLVIDSNYKFVFTGGGCLSRFASQGEWRQNGDTLIQDSVLTHIQKSNVACPEVKDEFTKEVNEKMKKRQMPTVESHLRRLMTEKVI